MSGPRQETTMTTTPTDAMVEAANLMYWKIGNTQLPRGKMRAILAAALAAMPTAEPMVTDEMVDAAAPRPDDEWGLGEPADPHVYHLHDTTNMHATMIKAIHERLRTHDAALAELRERVDRISPDVNRTMLDLLNLEKRHNTLVAKVQLTSLLRPERETAK